MSTQRKRAEISTSLHEGKIATMSRAFASMAARRKDVIPATHKWMNGTSLNPGEARPRRGVSYLP